MDNYIIVFEGLDGTGKSTLAIELAKKINAIYYKTPPKQFNERCIKMSRGNNFYTRERFLFFMDTFHTASNEIVQLLKNNSIVVDRWIWTTLSYHFANNILIKNEWGESWSDLTRKIAKPKFSFLLSLKDETLLERARLTKTLSENDQTLFKNKTLRAEIYKMYLDLNPNFIVIQNDGLLKSTTPPRRGRGMNRT
ncbi:MAG: hypothetical protein NT098_02145 [Candidatus Parcubacteria bacterium]|nr:hypothetical protein [Candidatus Parcubacteria bacterium]